jgi:DNA mismatch repair ATPase MutS
METKTMVDEMQLRYPNCIMLFQLDDFYFAYGEHACIISDVCGIYSLPDGKMGTSTSFSRHTAPKIIRQLIGAGLQVAVANRDTAAYNLN